MSTSIVRLIFCVYQKKLSKNFSFDAYEKQEMAPNYFEFPLQRNDGAGHQSHEGAHKYITPFKHCTLVNYIFCNELEFSWSLIFLMGKI